MLSLYWFPQREFVEAGHTACYTMWFGNLFRSFEEAYRVHLQGYETIITMTMKVYVPLKHR